MIFIITAMYFVNQVLASEHQKIYYFIREILHDRQELKLIFDNLQQSIFIVRNGFI